MGALWSSDSPWRDKGGGLREACGHVEEHQIILFAGRDDGAGGMMELALSCSDDTRPLSLLALQLGHVGAASSSRPELWRRVTR